MLAVKPAETQTSDLHPKPYTGLSFQHRAVLWVPGMPSLGHVHGRGGLRHCLLPYGPVTVNPTTLNPKS